MMYAPGLSNTAVASDFPSKTLKACVGGSNFTPPGPRYFAHDTLTALPRPPPSVGWTVVSPLSTNQTANGSGVFTVVSYLTAMPVGAATCSGPSESNRMRGGVLPLAAWRNGS